MDSTASAVAARVGQAQDDDRATLLADIATHDPESGNGFAAGDNSASACNDNSGGSTEYADFSIRNRCRISKAAKVLIVRICIRLTVIAVLIILSVTVGIPFGKFIDYYMSVVHSVSMTRSVVIFFIGATLFCALSPTGYLPTVLAGATYPGWLAPPIAYFSVVLGSMLNLVMVRHGMRKYLCKKCTGRVDFLEKLLRYKPLSIVVLSRLPYMGNGTLNYVFALSSVTWRTYLLGNCIGFLPGAIALSILGSQVHSLRTIIQDRGGPPSSIAIFCCICSVCILCIVGLIVVTRLYIKKEKAELALREREVSSN